MEIDESDNQIQQIEEIEQLLCLKKNLIFLLLLKTISTA